MATHSSILAWRILWTEEPSGLQPMESQEVGHSWATFTFIAVSFYLERFSSVQPLSHVRPFATPWTAACQAFLSITNFQSLLKHVSIELMMPSNHLIFCHPLLLPPAIFPSIRVFSNESVLCIRWPKYWSFSFSISPSDEYSGLISFRMDWLDLLAVQGTLKSFLQYHSSKASFFGTQLSLYSNSHIHTWLPEKWKATNSFSDVI